MSIHEFYLVAGYALWLYVMLCLCIKLLLERYRRSRRDRRMRDISLFFSIDDPRRTGKLSFARIRKDARDNLLFEYICDCYAGLPESCPASEKAALRQYMEEILHSRIRALKPDEWVERYLLINGIYHCRIFSEEIRAFLLECGGKTLLDQFRTDECGQVQRLKIAR